MTEDQQPKQNNFYYVSLRWATYCGISFLTTLGCIIPITRGACSLIILGYTFYIVIDTFRAYSAIEEKNSNRQKVLRAALSVNGLDMMLLLLAILAGLFIGLF